MWGWVNKKLPASVWGRHCPIGAYPKYCSICLTLAAYHLDNSALRIGVHEILGTFAGKKCLVLDIDYTLFDLNSLSE